MGKPSCCVQLSPQDYSLFAGAANSAVLYTYQGPAFTGFFVLDQPIPSCYGGLDYCIYSFVSGGSSSAPLSNVGRSDISHREERHLLRLAGQSWRYRGRPDATRRLALWLRPRPHGRDATNHHGEV